MSQFYAGCLNTSFVNCRSSPGKLYIYFPKDLKSLDRKLMPVRFRPWAATLLPGKKFPNTLKGKVVFRVRKPSFLM